MGVDDIVTVEMVNFSPVLTGFNSHMTEPTFKITGKVVNTPAWVKNKDEQFAIFVANSPVPLRVIHKRNVVNINGVKLDKSLDNESTTFKIEGSKGNLYTVSKNGAEWHCDCVGFQFRKHCKHIETAKARL